LHQLMFWILSLGIIGIIVWVLYFS